MEPLVENISDTAKWVAFFRAEESERPDAVFHDPFARKLAGEKGERIATAARFSRDNSWSFVSRTFLFDYYVTRHVEEGYNTVINLAAGLDARPYRLDLPANLKWIDVDLPPMISYKNKILQDEKPKCQLRSVPLDLADRTARLELFRQLGAEAKQALILSEGLVIYLTSDDVASLALDLSSQKNFRSWVFDLQSPSLLAMAQENMGSILKGSGAKFQFAPEEGEAFFEPYGWKRVESKSLLPTALKLNRVPEEFKSYAEMGEPPGPPRPFPWSGVCLLENIE
jgi:methyltransferase (TIGR00027 family)